MSWNNSSYTDYSSSSQQQKLLATEGKQSSRDDDKPSGGKVATRRPVKRPQAINAQQPQKKAHLDESNDNSKTDEENNVNAFQYKPKGFTKTVEGYKMIATLK